MLLKINNLSKTIHNKKVLDNISFSIKNSEIAIFLGKSGAGKSTLLRILNNLEHKDEGTILYNNQDIHTINNVIGIVFQHFNLFSHLTVLENIIFALIQVKKIKREEAVAIGEKLLDSYQLLKKKNNSIEALSGGEKQKIAIARTIAMEPQIICFDEPISSLDPYSTKEIIHSLIELKEKNYIVIMTTHNVSILAEIPATIHFLHESHLVESAKTKSYFDHPLLYPYINKFINAIPF